MNIPVSTKLQNSDATDRIVGHAWGAYQKYKELVEDDEDVDFKSFAVGYFIGAVAASGVKVASHKDKECENY